MKIRIWDIKNKTWVGHEDACNKAMYGLMPGSSEIEIIWSDDWLIQRSTSLKDKNGKEIYERDIVTWGKHCQLCSEITERVAEVKIDPDLVFQNHYPDGKMHDFHYGNFAYVARGDSRTLEHLEVIGNIYENPELIGKPV